MIRWQHNTPELFEEMRSSLQKNFPSLQVITESDVVFIRGTLFIFDDEQIELDRYSIKIKLLPDYPDSVPVVREIGGRIPRPGENSGDRHLFTNGNCCLFVKEETWKYYPKGMTIVDFIKNIVTYYFLNQTYYELTGKWLWGERQHGIYGIIEFYQEELKSKDLKLIVAFIQYLAKTTIKKNRPCYCGSRKKLQNCHYRVLNNYRGKINPEIAKTSLLLLETELEKIRNNS